MNDKFDELAKGLAQAITRRAALRRFGVGLGGVLLASLGLANKAEAAKIHSKCGNPCDCTKQWFGCCPWEKHCLQVCAAGCI